MTETIGEYLIRRLLEEGVGHAFGVPGDYVLTLFKQIEDSPLEMINTCDEQGAGFAADAYARRKGLGAMVVTYAVGGLKVANTVAQAYAERSPVVVISGAPGVAEQRHNVLLHHLIRNFDSQQKVFAELTVATAVLDNPMTAASEIDRVLALAKHHSRPVYIELPRDRIETPIVDGPRFILPQEESDPEVLPFALREAIEHIAAAARPVILAGIELHRFGLQPALMRFVETTGIPLVSTISGKSVFPESHPAYAGVYEGAMSRESARILVEESDCVIMLGAMLTDLNLGIFTAHVDRANAIYAAKDRVSVGLRSYDGIAFEDFVRGLAGHGWPQRAARLFEHPTRPGPFAPTNRPMTVKALFEQINTHLEEDMIVLADPGDALFAAADLVIHDGTHFLAPAYYASLGFAVPAAIGIGVADPGMRSLVLVGDGAFQMTGMELSTVARYGMTPTVIVLDNGGYGTERPMLDGAFNDVHRWNFARIPDVLGTGLGIRVETEKQMEEALIQARENRGSFTIIQVMLDMHDCSPALARLTAQLRQRVIKQQEPA